MRVARAAERAALAIALAAASPSAGECPDPHACIDDYLALPARLPAGETRAPPLEPGAVQALVERLETVPLHAGPLAARELSDAIEQALGLRFLRRAAAQAPLLPDEVRCTVDAAGRFTERALVFHDPYVGDLEALLLLPDGPGPFPAVLALHGHGDRAQTFRDRHHGGDYAAHGLALLVPTLRGMNIDAHEHRATRELLAHGLHLMGVRAYEALRALAYLQSRPDVDARHIGLIGHSGGSSLGNLLVRLQPGLRAYVSDHQVDYRSSGRFEPYHCETVPELYPLHRQINDLSTAPLAVLETRYGYGRRKWLGLERREVRRILAFFAEQLSAPRSRPARGSASCAGSRARAREHG